MAPGTLTSLTRSRRKDVKQMHFASELVSHVLCQQTHSRDVVIWHLLFYGFADIFNLVEFFRS